MDAEWVLLDEWEGVSQILIIFLAVSTVPVQINWFLSSCPSFPTGQNLSVAYLFLQNAFYAHYHLYPLVISLQLACPAVLPMFHLMHVLVSQLCPALCDTMDCSPPGISVHGILQARILEWVAIPFSRGGFPIQGSNLGLPHCKQLLYHLRHQGSPCFFLTTSKPISYSFFYHALYRNIPVVLIMPHPHPFIA